MYNGQSVREEMILKLPQILRIASDFSKQDLSRLCIFSEGFRHLLLRSPIKHEIIQHLHRASCGRTINILFISLCFVFVVEELMEYYLKILVLSFVWKWKIVIITFFCQFMEEL